MPEPILAANSSWFAPTVSSVTRASITEIEIMDSYTPDASVTVTDTWDASAAKDGSVTCYVIGTKLIIAGNGSGKVIMNEDGKSCFSDSSYKDVFGKCQTITGISLMDTSHVTDMSFLFRGCKVVQLDISSWDTRNVTNMFQIFFLCSKLTSLNVDGIDTSSVQDLSFAFSNCSALKQIDLSSWDTTKVSGISQLFCFCEKITSIIFPNTGFPNISDSTIREIFCYCTSLVEVDVSCINTEAIKSFSCMFESCSSLKKIIGLEKWNTSNVETMKKMFYGCTKLEDITKFNIQNWDTSSCTDMSFMFYQCSSLGEIDVSNWDTSKVTNLDHFAAHANLKRKGMGNWNTSSLVNANAAFHNCAEEELDLSGWDVSKVQFFCQMFENSPNLKRIKGLDKWNTSSGFGFDGMFERCYKLEEANLSSFDTKKAKNNVSASTNGHKTLTLNNMFLSCNNLKKVKLGENFAINGDGSNTIAANKLVLPTPSSTYIPGADGNWRTKDYTVYAPNGIPDLTEEVYYASINLVDELPVIVPNGVLKGIAEAIRTKNGTENKYKVEDIEAAILEL